MYSMDKNFMDAWEEDYRDDVRVKATVGSHTYTSDDGTIDDMELTETIGDGDTLPVGQSGSSELLLTLAGVDPDGLSGTTVRAYVAVGDSTWCPLGVFRVDGITSDDNYETIKLTCYDAMYYADKIDYESNLVFPALLSDVLSEVNSRTGLSMESSMSSLPGFTVAKEPSGYTCRQMYGFIAGVLGGNARISRTGKLQFATYAATSAVSIPGTSQYDDGGKLNHNNELKVDGLNIVCGGETWQYSGGADDAVAEYDASAAQDRSVLLKVYANDDGTHYAEVTGTGAMMDWANKSSVPWKAYFPTLASISFGEGVTSIGAHTCNCWPYDGKNLTSIMIASTVETIGASAFYFCSEITYVRIGDGVKTIGDSAFSACSKLASVYLPSSLQQIGNHAFDYCRLLGKLNPVVLPSSCESIGDWAFSVCTNLGKIQFGSGLKSIGVSAFSLCEALEKIDLSGCTGLESIGTGAFQGLNIVSVALAGSVAIGSSAFSGCENLRNIQLGQCKSIDYLAFSGCSALSALVLPATLESIGNSAFKGTPIEALIIPASCTSLSTSTFDGASSLKKLSGSGKYSGYSGILYDGTVLFRVPEAYSTTSVSAKAGTTGVGYGCCKNVAAVTAISLPATLKTISGSAFSNSSITSISIDLPENKISGSPWGATGATVTWTGGEDDG